MRLAFSMQSRDYNLLSRQNKFISAADFIALTFHLPQGNLITINASYKVQFAQTPYPPTNYVENVKWTTKFHFRYVNLMLVVGLCITELLFSVYQSGSVQNAYGPIYSGGKTQKKFLSLERKQTENVFRLQFSFKK